MRWEKDDLKIAELFNFRPFWWRSQVYFQERPAVLFQCCALLVTGFTEWIYAIAALCGASWASNFIRSGNRRKAHRDTLVQFIGFLKKYPNVKFKQYSLEDYADRQIVRIVKRNTRSRKSSDIHILLTKPAQKGEDAPMNMKTFTYTGGSYIVIDDPPDELHGYRKFMFLHELGHLSYESNHHASTARLAGAPLYFSAVWVSLQSDVFNNFWALTLLVVLCGAQVLADLWSGVYEQSAADFNHEIVADCFALAWLRKKDLAQTITALRMYSAEDPKLGQAFNTMRRELLLENLENIENGREITYYPMGNWIQPLGLVALLPVVMLALFARPLDSREAILPLIGLAFLATLWFCINLVKELVLKRKLAKLLAPRLQS